MRPAAIAAAAALAACGYGFSQRWVARNGAERVHVRAFENLSTEPELGAIVTAALRRELARRGADAGEKAPAAIEGDARATEPTPNLNAVTWRIGIEVRARLVAGGTTLADRTVRREGDYVAGADALETEGRRALAVRRLAGEAAREILRAFAR
jgi:hypothetical protein